MPCHVARHLRRFKLGASARTSANHFKALRNGDGDISVRDQAGTTATGYKTMNISLDTTIYS